MRLGIVGIGKMGSGIAERLLAAGYDVIGYDRRKRALQLLIDRGGRVASSLEDLTEQLPKRRVIWLMLPEGKTVDDTLETLKPHLSPRDLVIDGGNSHYRNSQRRAQLLAKQDIDYLDVGVSGGVWGRDLGFCLMVGGPSRGVKLAEPIFRLLAFSPDEGWKHLGPSGAGHFTKMVHNGVEYALMQAYAEGFSLLRKKGEFSLDVQQVAELWRHGSVVRSWLLDLIARILAEDSSLHDVEGWVPDSGQGRWTIQEAVELASPAPVMALALFERFASREGDSYARKLLSALRHEFGGHAVRKKPAAPTPEDTEEGVVPNTKLSGAVTGT